LLDVSAVLDLTLLVQLALAHRPEVIQTAVAAQVAELEISCQEVRRRSLTLRTFASGSDIHAQPLPAGSYDERYSPAAVGPEMPGTINGRQPDRVEQARAYAERARQVVEKTRNLVRLEVEQAYYRCLEASRKLEKFAQGAKLSDSAIKGIRESIKDFTEVRSRVDALLNTALIGSQLQIGQNEARYQLLIALAGLERATGGAFCAGLEKAGQISAPNPVTNEDSSRKEKAEDNKTDEKNGKANEPGKGGAAPLPTPRRLEAGSRR